MYICIYIYIVACAQVGNGTDLRTATVAAPLLLTSGPQSMK